MDCSKAKRMHPNLNVDNAKALIEAIGGSEPSPGDGALPPQRSRHPMFFDMTKWFNLVKSNRPDDPICGTAACIAGFAYALSLKAERDGRPGSAAHIVQRPVGTMTLADFLGVEYATAREMASIQHLVSERSHGFDFDVDSDVEPRHAARMLEIFLETGHVEWRRAMGRNPDGSMTEAEENRRRMTGEALRMRIEEGHGEAAA